MNVEFYEDNMAVNGFSMGPFKKSKSINRKDRKGFSPSPQRTE
jgi:hypothetical protein